MKIFKRIKRGSFKGYTIRKSKHGWFSLYAENGVSQTDGKLTLIEVEEILKTDRVKVYELKRSI